MSNQPRSEITFESAEVSTNAIWSAEQESFFIECMEQKIIQQPNRQTCTFNKEEWKQLRVELYNKFRVKYDNKQVKNKFHHLKQRYQTFKKILIACSGLGWDEILGTVTATDVWWEDHLKTNPQAKRFRRSGCPEYGSLYIIFGDTTARGELRASHKHTFDSSSEEGGNENILEGNDDNNTGFDDAFDSVPCTNVPSTQPEENTPVAEPVNSDPNDVPPESTRRSRSRSRTPAPNHRRARRDSRTSELTDAINAVAETSKERIVRRSKFSIEAAIEVLDNMNIELDDDLYLKVIDKFEIQGWREAFIVMAPQRRMAAVRRLIRD